MSTEPTKIDDESGEVVDERPYYCPGCGRRYETAGVCTGSKESSHEETAVVSVADAESDDAEHESRPWRR